MREAGEAQRAVAEVEARSVELASQPSGRRTEPSGRSVEDVEQQAEIDADRQRVIAEQEQERLVEARQGALTRRRSERAERIGRERQKRLEGRVERQRLLPSAGAEERISSEEAVRRRASRIESELVLGEQEPEVLGELDLRGFDEGSELPAPQSGLSEGQLTRLTPEERRGIVSDPTQTRAFRPGIDPRNSITQTISTR